MSADADRIAAYFDDLGTGEWDRLEATLQGRIKHAIHRRYLLESVQPGMRLLDAGCGPGRFAIDAAEAGAQVTLLDLSGEQLALAERNLAAAGLSDAVEGAIQGDLRELPGMGLEPFDVVVSYGGAVSYAYERHAEALGSLAGVARPGGSVLVGVMALYGAARLLGPLDAAHALAGMGEHIPWDQLLAGEGVVLSEPDSPEWHLPLAVFTAEGLRNAMTEASLDVATMATANPLVPQLLQIDAIEADEAASAALMELELAICDRPSLLDSGEHLIAVGRKR